MTCANKLNIEHILADSEPDRGYHEDVILPLSAWAMGTAATDPDLITASDAVYIQWDGGASQNGPTYAPVALPGQWAGRRYDTANVKRGELALVLLAGVVGTVSEDTLALDASLISIQKGNAHAAAVDPYKVTVNGVEEASPAGGAVIGDQLTTADAPLELVFFFDLKTIDPKSGLTVKLAPSAAPNNANDMRIYSSLIRYRRHASIAARAERDPIW